MSLDSLCRRSSRLVVFFVNVTVGLAHVTTPLDGSLPDYMDVEEEMRHTHREREKEDVCRHPLDVA